MSFAVLTHAATRDSCDQIVYDAALKGCIEARNPCVADLQRPVIWAQAHGVQGPCCRLGFGNKCIHITPTNLQNISTSWTTLRPMDEGAYVKQGRRHQFFTIVLAPTSLVPEIINTGDWRAVDDGDQVYVTLNGNAIRLKRGLEQHCHVAIVADEIPLVQVQAASGARNLDERWFHVYAVGRQYYTACSCDIDLNGDPCCRSHCDMLISEPGKTFTLSLQLLPKHRF
eukprot:5729022-Prymnesium_polylepis.1